jgi:DNA-binding CsgD family transcriptional regulator
MNGIAISTARPRRPQSSVPTAREAEVGLQVLAGNTNNEIGRALGISPRTVEVHRRNLMHKLGAKNGVGFTILIMSKQGGIQWLKKLSGSRAASR